jgi:acylglycerol lipase
MNHTEGFFQSPRDIPVFHQAWLPDTEPKAALIILHGLGSHSGRYMNIVDCCVPRGVAVYGFDQIHHGRSGGARGRVGRFADFSGVLAVYTGMVKARQAGKPLFLFGHSMGGLEAVYHLLDYQADFRGAVVSAPAIKIRKGISPAKILIGRVLSVVAPRAGVLRLDPYALSHDPAVVRAYLDDPLVYHGKTPARLAAEMMRAMRRVAKELGTIALPFLVFQGGADKIVDPGAARFLYDGAGSADKTIRIYGGLYHETFNEPERARVLGDMGEWISARM